MSRVYGVKNFRVTLQTVWAPTLCTVAKACGTSAKSNQSQNIPHNITQGAFVFFPSLILSSPSRRLAYSQPAPQSTCNRPSGSRFGSKLTWRNLRLAQGSAFQSMSLGQLEYPHVSAFLWLPVHLSQLINVLQPVRTSRVCSGTSEPNWRLRGQSGNRLLLVWSVVQKLGIFYHIGKG